MISVSRPTVVLNRRRISDNIFRILSKATASGARFRPHFKTHHSAAVGELFRNLGIGHITVSSVEMAMYFAEYGWTDICIAFPLNILEWDVISTLSQRVTLHVIVDHPEVAEFIVAHAMSPIHVWIDSDTGYGRTGIPWQNLDDFVSMASLLSKSSYVILEGILTHAGESYVCRTEADIMTVFSYTLDRMVYIQRHLCRLGFAHAISLGDTPTISQCHSLLGIDEIRPGNLALYDLMQWEIGSCSSHDIAIAVACPIVSKYPHRQEILVHGGGIHFSKDRLVLNDQSIYGRVIHPETWEFQTPAIDIVRLCQEHGVLRVSSKQFEQMAIGDTLYIVPVHSCMVMDLFFKSPFLSLV